MTNNTFIIIFSLVGYLCGSIPSAVIVSKALKLPDPQTHGSQNPGATNVLRIGGKLAGLMTLFGDIFKGVFPVFVARLLGMDLFIITLTAVAAFLGHLYPIFLKFRGGKGVATMIGVITILAWKVGLVFIVTWLLFALVFRYSSLASVVSAVVTPLFAWFYADHVIFWGSFVMSTILIWRHRGNIQRLISHDEPKI